MNKRLLESKMKLFGDTNVTLAIALGISPQALSAKKNETHGSEFRQNEIEKIKARYSLTAEELTAIFLLVEYLKKKLEETNMEANAMERELGMLITKGMMEFYKKEENRQAFAEWYEQRFGVPFEWTKPRSRTRKGRCAASGSCCAHTARKLLRAFLEKRTSVPSFPSPVL